MPSWILIPAYLLRNSIHRWFENVASPATKLLIPFLLTLFGLTIFGSLRGLEKQLSMQLEGSDIRTIRSFETIYEREAAARIEVLGNDRLLWEPFCESYESFQQMPFSGEGGGFDRLPIIVYQDSLSVVENMNLAPVGEPDEVFLLVDGNPWERRADVIVRGYSLSAKVLSLPEVFKDFYQKPAVILLPRSIAEPAMVEGFTQVQILLPKKEVGTERLEELFRTYALLEDRQVKIDSSIGILEKLRKLLSGQKLVRLALGVAFALILSLILGALALLEFRQEAYLLALMRSFGVRAFVLAWHFFMENLFLALSGVFLAELLFRKFGFLLYEYFLKQNSAIDLAAPVALAPSREDVQVLALAAILGVIFANVPVIWGLRKRPGLILS